MSPLPDGPVQDPARKLEHVSNRRTGNVPVHSITSAAVPLGDDISKRARRYLAQMAVRTLCFIGAVATWGIVPTWISVSLLVGAVILPYVAVVLANAGRERPERPDPFSDVVRELGTSPAPDAGSSPDARYGRSPFEQAPFEQAPFAQTPFQPGPSGPRASGPAGHPFDQARSDRARSEQARFDDAFYDRVPFEQAPFEQAPRTAPAADRPRPEGAVENGPIRG